MCQEHWSQLHHEVFHWISPKRPHWKQSKRARKREQERERMDYFKRTKAPNSETFKRKRCWLSLYKQHHVHQLHPRWYPYFPEKCSNRELQNSPQSLLHSLSRRATLFAIYQKSRIREKKKQPEKWSTQSQNKKQKHCYLWPKCERQIKQVK